jgi:hypothetical protein|tara:strand:+ start:1106 stop:1333 length:228 start_codon:yes stop_codon:yes gene_type:complete
MTKANNTTANVMDLNAAIKVENAKGFFTRHKRKIKYTAIGVGVVAAAGVGYYYLKKHNLDKAAAVAAADVAQTTT